MIAFKCKMCGGELNITEGSNICECEFCGTQQTIPSADNDKKVNLFNRANRLRMNAEFDKAATVYASITAEFPEEAEAYWGLCLCKYGIEYVDDPLTGNKIPTCHRTLPESIMDDSDFDQACENADPESKKLYREEAKAIDRLQQDILNIVASEEPFDVFICYKETDEDGERTSDSVISQEIYDFLTEKGLKVFFARITLEDKLGQQYEPYIYAALHSAKVMLAVGTQFDCFDAVWVKNEWARYLDMMKTDKSKTLIPCYKGIDAYDMPREFKNLQALNMDKIGWKQDLIRGIEKLIGEKKEQSNESQDLDSKQISVYLKRLLLFLESKEWNKVLEYCEKIFDIDPENAQAYIAKELAERKCSNISELAAFIYLHKPVESDSLKNARRFADTETKALLDDLDKQVITAKDYLKKKYADELKEQRSIPGWKEKKEKLEYVRERVDILMPRFFAEPHHTIILNTDGQVLCTEVTDDEYDIFDGGKSECGNWTSRMRLLNVTPSFVYGAEIDGGIVVAGSNRSNMFISYPGISRWQNIKDMWEILGYIYGVTEDGRVKVAGSLRDGNEYKGQDRVEELTDISSIIMALQDRVLFLDENGTIKSSKYFGERDSNDVWDELSEWTDIVKVFGIVGRIIGLHSDGSNITTRYFGREKDTGGGIEAENWTGIVQYYAMDGRIIGLRENGKPIVTDYYGEGEEDPKCRDAYLSILGWDNIAYLFVFYGIIVGLTENGDLKTTKYFGAEEYYDSIGDGYKTIANWNQIAAIKIGYNSIVGIERDGRLITAGQDSHGNTNVYGMRAFRNYDRIPQEISETIEAVKMQKKRIIERQREEAKRQEEIRQFEEARRREKIAKLQREREKLNYELANLKGLFTGKQKREIQDRLDMIQRELYQINNR